MKNVLFINFNCYWNPNFETELELMHQHQLDGNTVYSLHCKGELMQSCASALFSTNKKKFCKRCQKRYKLGCKTIKLPKECRFCLETPDSYPDYVSANYSTAEAVKALDYDGINIGFSMLENIMLLRRAEKLDLSEISDELTTALKISYIVYSNFKRICEKINPDAVYIFNGKFQEYEPMLSYCELHKIDYFFHERGASPQKYVLGKNCRWHELPTLIEIITKKYGTDKYTTADEEYAKNWFEEKRRGIDKQWLCYTKDQKRALMPADFDPNKRNITFFNSSLWEVINYDSWKPKPEFKDEIAILQTICAVFKDNSDVHLYLRIHPHLSWEPTDQLTKLLAFSKHCPENLTILMPEEQVDSYELLIKSDLIIVPQGSTIGVEACYWQKPCILLGPAIYQELDVCYRPENMQELIKLVKNTDLPPKPRKNSYIYGYGWSTFGDDYKYYKAKDLFEGEFLGVNIKNEIKIKNKIKKALGIYKSLSNIT